MTTTTSFSWPSIPAPLRTFFSYFPLRTYPSIGPSTRAPLAGPTLWIHPPAPGEVASPQAATDVLSADVECLKWQAYLALRGLAGVRVRWDVAPEGALDGRLPNLHIPSDAIKETGAVAGAEDGSGQLLAAHMIPAWVDERVGAVAGEAELEGYRDAAARDESRAWVTLLEGHVHAALILAHPAPVTLVSLLSPGPDPGAGIQTSFTIPLSGLTSLLPEFGARVPTSTIDLQYCEAIASLSERLGTDKWMLGSESPTFLDALVFAYLHCLLYSKDSVRIEVTRRVNLVAWERKVAAQVRGGFQRDAPAVAEKS